jgi:hypothetical protein
VRPAERAFRFLVVGALVATVCGCAGPHPASPTTGATSITTKEAMVTPDEARQEIIDLAHATETRLGGRWSTDAETWLECTSATGEKGAAFSYGSQRLDQPLGRLAAEWAADVRRLWRARGIPATIAVDRNLTPPHYYVSFPDFGTGTAPDGYLLILTVSDAGPAAGGQHQAGYADFSATSHCARGDSYELDVAEAARRASAPPTDPAPAPIP